MIPRHLSSKILKYSKEYPIIAIVGPRQSGKTTLVRNLFPNYKYISLENINLRQQAIEDPIGFLKDLGPFVILDEAQRVPELFSYLQEIVDIDQKAGQYILTGSSQFLLLENITQSLAGRIVTFKLYPLTCSEFFQYEEDLDFESLFQKYYPERRRVGREKLYELIYKGFYPRIHDKKLDSYKWCENYLLTYVERDVRSILNVHNVRAFERFLKLIASQSAQIMNYASLSNSLGISIPTIKNWISILETSGIIFILPPYFKNFSKRIVKTSKIYFVDTGILCFLLNIRTIEHLKNHPLIGNIFENFIVSECFKRFYNLGETPPIYFWRDQSKNEIDLLIDNGKRTFPIEIKFSQSINASFKDGIKKWLKAKRADNGMVIYCSEHILGKDKNITFVPWYML